MTDKLIIDDDIGNSLIIETNEQTKIVFLKLKNERHRRELGRIDVERKILFATRDKAQHWMFSNNSYGFNHYLLKNAKLFDTIVLLEETVEGKNIYRIPLEDAVKGGTFLHFKQNGFELQMFLSLKKFLPQYKVSHGNNNNVI